MRVLGRGFGGMRRQQPSVCRILATLAVLADHGVHAQDCDPQCTGDETCQTQCIAATCAAGQYILNDFGACTDCPAGYFCTGGTDPPEGCPAGTSLASTGGQSSADCGSCDPGYTAVSEGQASCDPCPAGSSCATRTDEPVPCTPGSYSEPRATACTQCPAGFYCPLSSAGPQPCPDGSYSEDGAASCTDCPAGSQCAAADQVPTGCEPNEVSSANAIACTPCPAGYSCPDSDQASLEACAVGTYSLAGETTCTTCPAGYSCAPDDLTACPDGSYADGATVSDERVECVPCDPGYMCADRTVSTRVACSPGSFSVGGESVCTVCPAGFACPNADGSGIEECEGGVTYSTGGQIACSPCQVGYACSKATHIPCGAGTYSADAEDEDGQVLEKVCLPCAAVPAGYFCDHQNPERECPAGTSSAGGDVTSCTECEAGYYAAPPAASCAPCEVGQFSTALSASCSPCPAGMSCSEQKNPGGVRLWRIQSGGRGSMYSVPRRPLVQ